MIAKKPILIRLSLLLGVGLGFALTSHSQEAITKDSVKGYVGVLRGNTSFAQAPDKPFLTSGDYVVDFPVATAATGGLQVTNASFLRVPASNDVLTVAFWIKKHDNANSSAFWITATNASGGERGFQAHLPWGTQVYFDTSGCCDTTLHRVNYDISSYWGYTDATWWNAWHHWVFYKNGTEKRIYIDGQVWQTGISEASLATNYITQLWLGSDPPDNFFMHGMMDDFAIYTNVLNDDDIGRLATGTAPDKLGGTNSLLAYWNFNDAPIFGKPAGTPLGFSITANNTGATVMDTNTITLALNGTNVTPTSVSLTGAVNTIGYLLPNPPFPSGSTQWVNLTIKDTNGSTFATSGSFVVPTFSTVSGSMALASGAVNKNLKGFKWRTFQVDVTTAPPNIQGSEDVLAGKYGTNVAYPFDPFDQNILLVDAQGFFTVTNTVNFNVLWDTTPTAGRFIAPTYPDTAFPGIVAWNANVTTHPGTERFVCEAYTALEFPAPGLYTMVVNSDDGFSTILGANPFDVFSALPLGQFDGTRGSADSSFQFFVEQAGLYPVRTLYWQGNGGGNLELFMVNADGTRVLINDTTNSIAAYRWVPTITSGYVKSVSPAHKATAGVPDLVTALIVDGNTPVNPTSVTLSIDGTPVTINPLKTGKETTVSYVPTPLFAPGSAHSATLAYVEGTSTVTRTWNFVVGPYSKDVLRGYVGTMSGSAGYSPNAEGRSGKGGDYAVQFGTTWGDVYIAKAADFLNVGAAKDEMCFSLWIRKTGANNDSSVFWANAPTAAASRGWQAHTPWGGTIYFDTAGCCNADTRISRAMNTANFPAYTSADWWRSWHHFVFLKKATYKAIWLDGILFQEGSSAGPLLPFTDMYLGGGSGHNANPMLNSRIDDFAVYSTALTTNQIQQLAAGASPASLEASAEMQAYWNFDDAPAGVATPTVSIGVVNGKPSIVFTGKLQSSATANGTYTDVTGATSPYQVDTTQAKQMFYKASQ